MIGALSRQRCWTHPRREAAGRCPRCRRYFCRECVTEHDGRLLCGPCLAALTAPRAAASGTSWLRWTLLALAGFALGFLLFYSAGYALQQLPPAWQQREAAGQ